MRPIPLPSGAFQVETKSKAQIQAEHDARIKAASKGAHKVSHKEQLEREVKAKEQAKTERKKQPKREKKAPEVPIVLVGTKPKTPEVKGPKPFPAPFVNLPKAREMFLGDMPDGSAGERIAARKATLSSAGIAGAICAMQDEPDPEETKGSVTLVYETDKEAQSVLCKSGVSALQTAEAVLESGSVNVVRFERGCILTLLGKDSDGAIYCIDRKFYANADKAHEAGVKALTEKPEVRDARVDVTITRVQFAAEQKAPKRDVYNRKPGPVCQQKNYNRNPSWQKTNMGDSNVRTNMGPSGFSLGWNVRD